MEPGKKTRLRNALRNVARDAEDAEMEEIESVIDLVSGDPEAWHFAQQVDDRLRLPDIRHSPNAAITQLRYSLWPEKIQMCLLSGGSSEETDKSYNSSDTDSLGSLPRDSDEILGGSNSGTFDTPDRPVQVFSSNGKRLLGGIQKPKPIASRPTPPPSSGQQVILHLPTDAPSQQDDEDTTVNLPGMQQFKRMRELKQKMTNAGSKETETSQKPQNARKRRRNKSPISEGEGDEADIEGRILELEMRETGLRKDCKDAMKLFSPSESIAKTPWLKAPSKAETGKKNPEERLRFVEERFQEFDNFIIKQVQVQDDEPVRFDNSASVEARVGVLEEKAVELDRKLRKEVRKSGTWNRR